MTNEDKIKQLDTSIQNRVRDFIALSEKEGESLLITQGLRTISEQNALYAQGRTKPGKIVTNAVGGNSWHNYGLAVDVCREGGTYPNASDPFWDRLAKRAAQFGLEHGDQGYVDKPHFQYRGGLQLSDVKAGKRPQNTTNKPTIDNQNNITKKPMKLLETRKCVWIKAEGQDSAEYWVIRKNEQEPYETRHKVNKDIQDVATLFGSYGKLSRVDWPVIAGLTEKGEFDLRNLSITHPELFESI